MTISSIVRNVISLRLFKSGNLVEVSRPKNNNRIPAYIPTYIMPKSEKI